MDYGGQQSIVQGDGDSEGSTSVDRMVKARERLRKGAVHTLLDQSQTCHKITEIF